MPAAPITHLHAVTRPLERPVELLRYTDAESPLVWTRGDRGCAGSGEAMRLEFSGEDRFTAAAAAWRGVAEHAVVDDPIRLPGTGLIAFGTFAFDDRSAASSVLIVPEVVVSHHGDAAWVTRISTEPILEPPASAESWLRELLTPRNSAPERWTGTVLDTDAIDAEYLAGVEGATQLIADGHAEKIVIARQVTGSIDAADDLRVPLSRLAESYTDCWTYAVDGMIGASPETLVRQSGGTISARVLAGTRGRRADRASDLRERDELLANQKEQHEHAFAVQSVVTALAPHVRDLHTSVEPFALELPNVWHLATDLRAVPAEDRTCLDLVAVLHPTAAVAGTPTREAVEAIARLEPFDRQRYAGATGWIGAHGDGEWVIALRGAQIGATRDGRRTVTAYAGGGIVAGSDSRHELRETVSKFTPIAEALAP